MHRQPRTARQAGRSPGLLRHRLPAGDLPALIEAALDILIAQTKKERFAVGRKARTQPAPAANGRSIPAAIRRAVYERDGGRCTFSDDRGRRCNSSNGIEFDHVDGFARTRAHSVESLRLRCRAHNQLAAEQLYGRAFMDRTRMERSQGALPPGEAACPGTSSQQELL